VAKRRSACAHFEQSLLSRWHHDGPHFHALNGRRFLTLVLGANHTFVLFAERLVVVADTTTTTVLRDSEPHRVTVGNRTEVRNRMISHRKREATALVMASSSICLVSSCLARGPQPGGRHAGFKINHHDGAGGEFTVKSPPAIDKEQQQPASSN